MNISQAVFRPGVGIVDTHCHLNLSPIADDWQSHWQRAQEAGVRAAWIPGTTVESSRLGWQIAQQEEHLWSLVGIHPGEVDASWAENPEKIAEVIAALEEMIVKDRTQAVPKILGIGEIGLDFFRLEGEGAPRVRAAQKDLCSALIDLARRYNLLVSLHVRDKDLSSDPQSQSAYWEVLSLVQKAQLEQPFILHCSSGPLAYVEQALALGAYVSFAGNVTYPNAQPLRDIWQITPENRRLLETDVPFLPPQGYRGKMCEPWMIAQTASWLQDNELAKQ